MIYGYSLFLTWACLQMTVRRGLSEDSLEQVYRNSGLSLTQKSIL